MTFYWLPQISICRSLQFPQWEITEVPPLFYDRRTEIKNLTFFEDQRTTHLPTPSLWEAKSTLFSVWFFLWHQKTCVGQQVLWFPIFQKELDFHTTKKEEWSNLRTTFIHISVNILSTNTGIKGEGQFFKLLHCIGRAKLLMNPKEKMVQGGVLGGILHEPRICYWLLPGAGEKQQWWRTCCHSLLQQVFSWLPAFKKTDRQMGGCGESTSILMHLPSLFFLPYEMSGSRNYRRRKRIVVMMETKVSSWTYLKRDKEEVVRDQMMAGNDLVNDWSGEGGWRKIGRNITKCIKLAIGRQHYTSGLKNQESFFGLSRGLPW